jgi:hypothetical protein
MTNFELWERLNILIRKDKEGGTISPDEYNELLDWGNMEMHNMTFPFYEQNQDVKDALLPFTVIETVTQTLTNINLTDDLTETYSKLISSPYYNDGTVNREIEVVTDAEWTQRLSSALKLPTSSRPICRLYTDSTGDKILRFYPISGEDIELSYLKEPVKPTLTVTLDSNDNYVQSASTEMEWREEEKIKILYLIAQKLGVNLDETDVLQYSMTKQNE